MANAAAYGNIQPSEFLDMDVDDATELARRVTLKRREEFKTDLEIRTEMLKVIIKALGARGI